MQKMYTPARIVAIFTVLAIVLTVYVSAMYAIQVYAPWQLADDAPPPRLITRRSTVPAARGNIFDRNGVLLASGRPSYNVKIDWWALRNNPHANDIVQELIYAAMDEGLTFTDTFPVTRGAPFEFVTNMSQVQESRLNAYKEFHELDPEISVSDLLAWMRNHYKIDYTVGILDARLIIGVRYELEIRAIVGTISPYIFTHDVSTDFVSYLEERGLTGVYIESTFVREYHTVHAPHMIGYTGAMTAEEYEIYRELGYPMDAIVGKIGAESAFEEILHGSNGEMTMRLTGDGTVVSVEVTREPVPGQHVYLTLDLGIQIVAEHALRSQIENINQAREQANLTRDPDDDELELIPGGAVVVTNVHTGEILAAASYPTFSLQNLAQDWAFLNSDPSFPMLNRATQGRYSPGSTFKMVTALAALRNIDRVTRYYPVDDTGLFDRWEHRNFIAHCWIFRETRVGHGMVDVVSALECSCNFYFLHISDIFPGGHLRGAEYIAEAAQEFGLGRRTGLEIPEFAGRLALPEVKREIQDEGWYVADTLLAGFGQGLNRFTPVQLANYAATIANGGTLYSLSFLRRVVSSDFETLYTQEPEVLNVIEETEYIEILQEGMVAVSRGNRGTARRIFGNYDITVASKTGTVQIEGQAANDGSFVAYAPADNPEIAISIVVEKGGSGSEIMEIAKVVFDHYFMTGETFLASPYGQMIP